MRQPRVNWAKLGVKDHLIAAQNNLCHYCNLPMGPGNRLTYPTIEHVIPLSKGGTDDLSNIVIACMSCNELRSIAMQTEDKQLIALNARFAKFANKEILCIYATLQTVCIKFATGEEIRIPNVSKVLITETTEHDV